MKKELFEKKVKSDVIFKGCIIDLYLDKVKLPNGRIATREKVSHPGAVGIIPVTGEGKIILVEQFRYPVEEVLMEIPAGKIDKNELPLECAKRELKEETGAEGGNLVHLTTFYSSPGFCNENMHLYMAENFKRGKKCLEDDEFLNLIEIEIKEALSYIKNGKLRDAKTIVGILLTYNYLIKRDKAYEKSGKKRFKL
ncbi:MAG: NUDIX hydrolase [Actinomycetota bacterium]|nr:NUDIX hydrolase [Actinomycetota bacterium]